jgi:hypothetical protein
MLLGIVGALIVLLAMVGMAGPLFGITFLSDRHDSSEDNSHLRPKH